MIDDDEERTSVKTRRVATLLCIAGLGLASGIGVAACGEDRGGVEVEGGGTTGTAGSAPTSTATP